MYNLKSYRNYLAFIILTFCVINVYAQDFKVSEYLLPLDYKCPLIIDKSLQEEIDSVFPGVKFLIQHTAQENVNWLFTINMKDTTLIRNYNLRELQFESSLIKDSVIRYSDFTISKCFILFDVTKRQGGKYYFQQYSISEDNIHLQPCNEIPSFRDGNYQEMDSAHRFINMKASVLIDPKYNINCCGAFRKITQIDYEFQIVNKIVCGVMATFHTISGQKLTEKFHRIQWYETKYDFIRYKSIREAKSTNDP